MANVLINAPKQAKKGETIGIKALILHPMETGFRPGTNGKIIPRNIIETFTATWNNVEIFRMTMTRLTLATLSLAKAISRALGDVGLVTLPWGT